MTTRRLRAISGRAGEIDLRYSKGNIPKDVLHLWRGLLQTALYDCYGREGAAKFYRRDDVTEITPVEGDLWFSTHYARLSDFITEQSQVQSILHKTDI